MEEEEVSLVELIACQVELSSAIRVLVVCACCMCDVNCSSGNNSL